MPLAQDIYDTLVKDPDLDVGENQTREEAAQTEADFRARQYVNNVRALSLATEPLEKVSPIKALLQHVSSISKTIVSGSISIAQNILKASQAAAVQNMANESIAEIFKDILSSKDEKTQQFVKAYVKTQQGQTNVNNAHLMADYLEAGHSVDHLLDAGVSDNPQIQAGLQELGIVHSTGEDTPFGKSLKANLSTIASPSGEPIFNIPFKAFKPESSKLGEEKGMDYGKNNPMMLNSTASVDKINSALGRQNSPYSVAFGGSGKLKLANKDGSDLSTSNLHNPFPSGTHGRLFQSMAAFKAPTAGEQNTGHFDATSLSQHSVADILNAVHWISNQETPKQAAELATVNEESADLTQKAVDADKEMFTKEAEINPELVNTAPSTGKKLSGHPNLSKPHVLVHSHGKVMHKGTEHEYRVGSKNPKINEHSHVPLAYNHQICNSHGQLNKLGYALLD